MTTTTAGTRPLIEHEPHVVQRLVQEGKAVLIDVRDVAEHRQEHIAGTSVIPATTIAPANVAGRATILHCRSGRRSAGALQKLLDAGAKDVSHMKGGIEAWKSAGLPTVVDRKAPMTPMQQTQLVMGFLVASTAALGAFVTPWALGATAFVGCGMMFAGITGSCAMANLLAKAPWNRSNSCGSGGGCAL
ncbi:MAG: rhodanese-like domain-containing protein [Phycisphaerae bacterium]|nr:rhodanese-like domain-containing protein [Phycisphaerae bacterium]